MQLVRGSLVLLLGLVLVVGGVFAGGKSEAVPADLRTDDGAAVAKAPAATCGDAAKTACCDPAAPCDKCKAKAECPKAKSACAKECAKDDHCQAGAGGHYNKDCSKGCHAKCDSDDDCCNHSCGDTHKCGEGHKNKEHHEQCLGVFHWGHHCGHHGHGGCGDTHCSKGACAGSGCHGWYRCNHRHWTTGEATLSR